MISEIFLPKGFVSRTASNHDDVVKIIELCCQTWGEEGRPFIESVILNHPRIRNDDHFMIIDKTTSTLCSYLCRLPDKWRLEGLEILADHMEFVNTSPEYRGRGFVQFLNTEYNKRANSQKSVIQIVSGLPYFYRLLGYEYAAEAYGGPTIVRELVPDLPNGLEEPVTIEQVSKDRFKDYVDYRKKMFTGILTRVVDVEDYDYLCFGDSQTRDSITFYLVKTADQIVGIFWLRISKDCAEMDDLCLDNVSHLNSVLRFAKDFVSNSGQVPLIVRPAMQEVIENLLEHVGGSRFQRKQAWYIRIPNLGKLISHMIPLLNARLSKSEYKEYMGQLRISTYQEAFQLSIKQGCITSVDSLDISISREWGCDLYLPPQAAPRLILGYMTLDELERYHNDILVRSSLRKLVNVFFPKVRTRALWSP